MTALRRFCIGFAVLFVTMANLCGAQDLYAKQDTWAQTMLAARARYLAWLAEEQTQFPVTMSPWYATAPLRSKPFAAVQFPEEGVDLEAKDKDGNPRWQQHADWADGAVRNLPRQDWAATYLFRTITAQKYLVLPVSLGSDDGIAVWLNGEQLIAHDVPRGAGPDQEKLELNLKTGDNGLLIKIYNQTGDHAYYFSAMRDPIRDLWNHIGRDFPSVASAMREDVPGEDPLTWLRSADGVAIEQQMIARALDEIGECGQGLRDAAAAVEQANPGPDDPRRLDLYAQVAEVRGRLRTARSQLAGVNIPALRRAIADLMETYPEQYVHGAEYVKKLDTFEQVLPGIEAALVRGEDAALQQVEALLALQREALLTNPLLDFDKLLLIKRRANQLGLPQNWQGNCAIPTFGYDNEIDVLSPVRPGGTLTTLYRPDKPAFVGDVDLSFDADKMLFSMPGSHTRWQIWEIGADGSGLRQVTPGEEPDVDNYDACYLPDGRIMFDSTRTFQGIPCVGGSNTVANLCLMDADGQKARQLCFDQDHDWCPTVMNDGRVLYSRWEYSDTPHYFSRLLFRMNPDGTEQMEYYGSNSFWPNSIFYARPIPGHPTEVVAIVSGHHGVPRMGELVLFDPAKGRHEADGVVQRIPGYGQKVEPVIADQLVADSWPKFLHPYPLSGKYFLVSCAPTPSSPWGIYLVDVFDNLLPILEIPGYALLEPVPFRKTPPPPAIPDRVRLDKQDAVVYMTDVYQGNGLKGVPRGTVKNLRLYEFHYAYPQMGGHMHIGYEGPWDVHRIMGTVPVEEDGSAIFKVPANTPIAVQPLDAEGKALQVMRSWFAAMPGETLSCVGCHERQNTGPTPRASLASRRAPSEVTPWYGPTRGFSFPREVQPVLDKYCVGCHNGEDRPDGMKIPCLKSSDKNGWNNFTPSYLALHPYVRRPGPESDYHLQTPLEFHADTSELVQMLTKGHHGVQLDPEAWDRLITWIDLNVPDHGTWHEQHDIAANFHERRLEMRTKYANRPEDPEIIPDIPREPVAFVPPQAGPAAPASETVCAGWPFSADDAKAKQAAAGSKTRQTLDLGDGVTLDLALIPAGEFLMGSADGARDEVPVSKVKVDEPFWMGTLEVTFQQYRQFDPLHDNGVIDQRNKDHTMPGYPTNEPNDPAIRMTWQQAVGFCEWLSQKTGLECSLPTEAQWEWACRAGAATPFWYGDFDADFSAYANLADAATTQLAVAGINPQPIANPSPYEDFLPKDTRFNDGMRLMTTTGSYAPNAWGLCDMHGNVCEWTRSSYRPYPYRDDDGRNDLSPAETKVVRGGSWRDRPKVARSSYRLAYRSYEPVYNVGFRVVCRAR